MLTRVQHTSFTASFAFLCLHNTSLCCTFYYCICQVSTNRYSRCSSIINLLKDVCCLCYARKSTGFGAIHRTQTHINYKAPQPPTPNPIPILCQPVTNAESTERQLTQQNIKYYAVSGHHVSLLWRDTTTITTVNRLREKLRK